MDVKYEDPRRGSGRTTKALKVMVEAALRGERVVYFYSHHREFWYCAKLIEHILIQAEMIGFVGLMAGQGNQILFEKTGGIIDFYIYDGPESVSRRLREVRYDAYSADHHAYDIWANEMLEKLELRVKRESAEPVARSHNCWQCKRSEEECFNKRFVPKESNEGMDCKEWK